MKNNRTGFAQLAFALITLGIAAAIAAPAFAQDPGSLQIRSIRATATGLRVIVTNATATVRSGIIAARIIVNGHVQTIFAPVTAASGQSASIDVKLPPMTTNDPITGVVVDDGVPF